MDLMLRPMFVYLKTSINGFKIGCRPFIGLDDCSLRSNYQGIMLSTSALYGNNGLFPVTFAVDKGESEET